MSEFEPIGAIANRLVSQMKPRRSIDPVRVIVWGVFAVFAVLPWIILISKFWRSN